MNLFWDLAHNSVEMIYWRDAFNLICEPLVRRRETRKQTMEMQQRRKCQKTQSSTDYNPDQDTTDEEQSSHEELAEVVLFHYKNGKIYCSSSPEMFPSPTRHAISRVDDIKSCFELFLAEEIETILVNLEGRSLQRQMKGGGPGRHPSIHGLWLRPPYMQLQLTADSSRRLHIKEHPLR